jgi:putative heme-binding domain-containing protein
MGIRMMIRSQILFVVLGLGLTTELQAQRDLKKIPIPDPEVEKATFVLPDGFEVNLFAADPQIAKPIQINFDARGRLWIASSSVYPQIEPGAVADDRILIVEDLNGDGVADTTKVFAGGLLIPTGVEPGDGGAYVGASTELLHLVDLDGDDQADERRIVLSGFGTEDTHHILHTLRWGPEQRLYMSQSIYIHSHIETPWGIRRLNAGGIWQFRPETLQLEVFARGWVNTWGTAFDQYGVTFATDGAGGEGINYAVPGAAYATAYGAPRILPGLNPGSPKHCGLEVAYSPHLPEDWQGSLLTNDFRGHRVCRFVLSEDGSGFVSREQQEVIKSSHPAFRPVDIKLGPDGAIYIADWYNPIIQHGEVDFRDPRRDHTHGRIWRVTYRGKPVVPKEDLTQLSTPELVERLASTNHWTRHMSKRVLKERGPDVLPVLKQWSRSLDNTAPGYHRLRLEALWMYLALDTDEPELLQSLLECKDASARAAATRVAGERYPERADWLQARVTDEHPRVRLEAVRALANSPDPQAVSWALRALDQEVDSWLDYALWQTVRELQPHWLPLLNAGQLEAAEHPRQLLFLLKSAGIAEGVPRLLELLQQPDAIADKDLPEVLETLVQFSTVEHLNAMLAYALAPESNTARAAQLLSVLRAVAERRQLKPEGDLNRAASLLTADSPTLREWGLRCLGLWQVAEQRPMMEAMLRDQSAPLHVRSGALEAVAAFKDAPAADSLQQLVNSQAELSLRQQAVRFLLGFRPRQAAGLAVQMLQGLQAEPTAAEPVLAAFLARKDGAGLLAAALSERTVPADVAIIALRMIGSSGQPQPELAEAFRKAGNVSGDAVQLTPEQLREFAAEVTQLGDPARGEAIYRRASLNCIKCHAIGPAGGQVGPNMLSLGTTAQLDYIIESLLDPNAKVKEGFNTLVVATDDGKVYSGIQVRRTDRDLILRDAENRELQIPLDQIEGERNGTSLMPAGLTASLTRQELIDLTAFLSALGRLPDYTISTSPMIRSWRALLPTPEARQTLRRNSYAAAATAAAELQWQPVVTTVRGDLPLTELPAMEIGLRIAPGSQSTSFVQTTLEVPASGELTLQLEDVSGLQGWLNDQPLNLATRIPLKLAAGPHQLTLAIDRDVRQAPLRITLE